jgi:hypothetical protein
MIFHFSKGSWNKVVVCKMLNTVENMWTQLASQIKVFIDIYSMVSFTTFNSCKDMSFCFFDFISWLNFLALVLASSSESVPKILFLI